MHQSNPFWRSNARSAHPHWTARIRALLTRRSGSTESQSSTEENRAESGTQLSVRSAIAARAASALGTGDTRRRRSMQECHRVPSTRISRAGPLLGVGSVEAFSCLCSKRFARNRGVAM